MKCFSLHSDRWVEHAGALAGCAPAAAAAAAAERRRRPARGGDGAKRCRIITKLLVTQ